MLFVVPRVIENETRVRKVSEYLKKFLKKLSKLFISDFWLATFATHPVDISHILIVLSLDEESRKSAEGRKVTEDTLWSWPWKDLMHRKEDMSHSFTEMSAEQEAEEKKTHSINFWLNYVTYMLLEEAKKKLAEGEFFF